MLCSLTLRLPVYSSYDSFKEAMLLGVLGSDGFGIV